MRVTDAELRRDQEEFFKSEARLGDTSSGIHIYEGLADVILHTKGFDFM